MDDRAGGQAQSGHRRAAAPTIVASPFRDGRPAASPIPTARFRRDTGRIASTRYDTEQARSLEPPARSCAVAARSPGRMR